MAEYFPFDIDYKSYSGSFSGSFFGDGGGLTNIKSSNISGSVISASYAATASFLLGSVVSASYALTASFALNGGGGSTFPFTGSAIITGSLVVTGSTISTLGFTGSLFGTSSWATNALTASRILTQTDSTNANYFLTFVDTNNATPTVETLLTATNITINPAARSLSIQSAVTGGVFLGPLTGSVFGTASWATNFVSASNYVLNSATSSFVTNSQTGSFATTGSNIFKANQTISGSLIITGSIIVTGSITASAFNFASSSLTQSRALLDNTFSDLNISGLTPDVRTRSSLLRVYGTYTTGSANTSLQNHILAAHIYPTFNPTNNSTSTFNTLTLEPQFLNTNATGSARGLLITPGFLGNHPNWRTIEWDTGLGYGWGLYGVGNAPNYLNGNLSIGTLLTASALNVNGNTEITGSLNVSGSITGSLFGTASFALTASKAPNASLSMFGNYAGTGFTNPIITYLPFGTTAVSATESQRQIVTPMGGTLKNIYIRTNGAAAATSFTTFTIRVNGVATNVKINISGGQAAGLYSNTINSASVVLGDEISLQVSTSIANGPQVNQYSFGIFNT